MKLCSVATLADWFGDLTMFNGFYDTRPASELMGAPWGVVLANIAPGDAPACVPEKERAPYFVPSALKVAPLVNGTRAKADKLGLPLLGKQRSAAHVTQAQMIVFDLDGIGPEQLVSIESRLTEHGLTSLLYSTHSNGRADRPGIRCRGVIPVDRGLDPREYKLAAAGLNAAVLDDLADVSGFALHQQQGVWATARERAHLAFRRTHKLGIVSVAALMAAAPQPKIRQGDFSLRVGVVKFDHYRIANALQWIDPNTYGNWVNVAVWLKAAYGDTAFPAWLAWSEGAGETSKAGNDGRYAPERVWRNLEPRLTADQGAAALFAHARDNSLAAAKAASKSGVWGKQGCAALAYLRGFHKRLYDEKFVRDAA